MNPTTPTPNYELLREAAAIIDGIPARRFDLNNIIRTKNGQPVTKATDCGAIGCGIGWLGLHPKFRALGLVTSYDPDRCPQQQIVWDGRAYTTSQYSNVAAMLFGIDQSDAVTLFRTNYNPGSDKAEFRRRVVAFLKANGQTVGGREMSTTPTPADTDAGFIKTIGGMSECELLDLVFDRPGYLTDGYYRDFAEAIVNRHVALIKNRRPGEQS